jgi:transposase
MDGMVRNGGRNQRQESCNEGEGRRRRWSAVQKAAMVAESCAVGARVSDVAARHGVNESLLFTWRRQAMASKTAVTAPVALEGLQSAAPPFVPVMVCEGPAVDQAPPVSPRPVGLIEIAVADANIRVTACVDAATLAMVLAAVRGAR